jgi:hypothetical protein
MEPKPLLAKVQRFAPRLMPTLPLQKSFLKALSRQNLPKPSTEKRMESNACYYDGLTNLISVNTEESSTHAFPVFNVLYSC